MYTVKSGRFTVDLQQKGTEFAADLQ